MDSLTATLRLGSHYVLNEPAMSDYSSTLRTPELKPLAERFMADVDKSYVNGKATDIPKSFSEFLMGKQELAEKLALPSGVDPSFVRAQRFLSVSLGHGLSDALVPAETRSFFMEHEEFGGGDELPPWDTWIDLLKDGDEYKLICWIPQWAIPIVERAIELDYLQAYAWHPRPHP